MKTEKTAMQQLIDFLEPELKMHDFLQLPAYEKAKELLETEKYQIKRAFNVGGTEAYEMSSDDYYNDTFESTNKEPLK